MTPPDLTTLAALATPLFAGIGAFLGQRHALKRILDRVELAESLAGDARRKAMGAVDLVQRLADRLLKRRILHPGELTRVEKPNPAPAK